MEERIISLNGYDTRLIERTDDGPTLLFLHGFPEHAGGWKPVMARLDGFRCLAPDQRGYGTSYRPPDVAAYRAHLLARDVLDLISTLKLDRVHLVGHDWGAAVAYMVAFANDPRIVSLTIANGVHPAPFQRELAKGGAQSEASQYMNWLRRPDSHEILAANDFEKLIGFIGAHMDASWLTGAVLEEYKRAWAGPETLDAMVNWYRASGIVIADPGKPLPTDKVPVFDAERMRVRVPHLLIWGMGDVALLPESRDGLAEYCDSLEVHQIAEADHWVVHQKPDEVARLIRDFAIRVEG